MSKAIVCLALATLLAGTAVQAAAPGVTTFTETFDGGSNTGGWTFGNPFYEEITPDGGNPGAFYHNTFLDTFAPQPQTTVPSTFTGDYRALGVKGVAVDMAIFYVDFSSEGRLISVILTSDPGTPDDPFDDCSMYKIGNKVAPDPDGTWKSYSFKIPSQSHAAPEGWAPLNCGDRNRHSAWNDVIEDVDRLTFFVGDPKLFYIFQVWDIGIDNPTITWGVGEAAPRGDSEE